MRERWAVFESPALGPGRHEVRALEGVDELNRLFRFDLLLVLPRVLGADDVEPLLEGPAQVAFEEDGAVLRTVHGIVAEAALDTDAESDVTRLRVALVPRAWLLTQRRGSEIFLGRSVPEVLCLKLEAIGLHRDVDFALSLVDRYPTREYIAQHDETDHAFFARLCEHVGITTVFDHRDGRDVLVLTDTPTSFRPVPRPTLPVRRRREHPAAYDVRTTLRRVPAHAEGHDYNYRTPLVPMRERSPIAATGAAGTWTELGPHTKTTEDTRTIARVRAEETATRHHVVEARTTEASVHAGGTVVLTGQGEDRELLLTKVAYRFRGEGHDVGDEAGFTNDLTAIPVETRYRPPRTTPWPRVQGLSNAIVDGAIKGDYAEIDEAGRYHLRMLFDPSGRTNLGATHPVRMMQPHAGPNYGMHFPLRPGTEVLVGYVNGDPDRPIIVGTAPNPVTASPVLRQNQTQNVLRTGSNNEMVIEDEHGSERIRIHTPKDDTTIQLGTVEEPEEGVLTRTEANISEASRLTSNEATTQKTVLAETSTAVLGRTAVIAVGVGAVTAATERGIERPSAVSLGDVEKGLAFLSESPEMHALPKSGLPGEDVEARPSGGGAAPTSAATESGALWSDVGSAVTTLAEDAAMRLVRAAAAATDGALDQSKGRAQGEPLGEPDEPAATVASTETTALVGRQVALMYGDRTAALSSFDTASVVGGKTALLKSPGKVEVAGGETIQATTAGDFDVAAKLVRIVGGYYPEAEAPPLDEATSIGVMARRDLRFMSIEHCIVLCAKKNLLATAHAGDARIKAKKMVAITGGSIVGSAGTVTFTSSGDTEVRADGNVKVVAGGNVSVEAGGDVTVVGATVTVQAGSITLDGPTTVNGDLTVAGAIHGG